jgi:hypothetical protein
VNNENKMISNTRKAITAIYQPFQLLKKGALSFSGADIYLRVVLNQPVRIIIIPNTKPIRIPILTFLISIPNANPMRMAKIKAISPLRILGFLSSGIRMLFSCLMQ